MSNPFSHQQVNAWAKALFDRAAEYPVGLITGLAQDNLELIAKEVSGDKAPLCANFFEENSCSRLIARLASYDQILRLSSKPLKSSTPSERLFDALLPSEGIVLHNLQLAPKEEIYKLHNVRSRRMAERIPFSILAIGFGNEDSLKNKMAPLASSLQHRRIEQVDMEDLPALFLHLGLSVQKEESEQLATIIFLYSERYGSLRELLNLYLHRHGTQLAGSKLVDLLNELNPNCAADKDALAKTQGAKHPRRNKKDARSTRPTPPPSTQ